MPAMLMAAVTFSLMACDDTGKPTSAGTAAPVKAIEEAPPPPADVDVLLPAVPEGLSQTVKVEGSSIQFTGAKLTRSHDGSFAGFSGQVILKDDQVIGTVFTIDLTSTTADSAKLAKHLMSKDFFDVAKYGEAKFVSSSIEPAPNPGAVTHKVEGVLDFHGKTRPLSFPASISVGETETTVTATFDINRQNWGVAYPGKPDDLIKDDVELRLNLTFPVASK